MVSWATGCYTEGFSDTCIILALHLSAPFLCTWMIGTVAWTEGDYIMAFLMSMQGDVMNAYCSVMDKVSQKLSPDNGCA